jgi:translation initiation factor IF-2
MLRCLRNHSLSLHILRTYAKSAIVPLSKRQAKGEKWQLYKKMEHEHQRVVNEESNRPLVAKVYSLKIDRPMCARDFAPLLGIKPTDLVTILPKEMDFGIDDVLSVSTIADVCKHLHVKMIHTPPATLDPKLHIIATPHAQRKKNQQNVKHHPRSPVVTIMGHVDHGKTTLLDALRNTNVVEKEAGGITQHIAAFQVHVQNTSQNVGSNAPPITFIDTPGHEAFVAMRAAGAQVTDIIVLVVAADDGIMPQTKEAIKHARDSNVPIIVAINKIDKNNADVDNVIKELAQNDLQDAQMVPISALKRQNLDKLIDEISILSQVLELSAPTDCQMEAIVIESHVEKGHGMNITAIVKRGIMQPGQWVICGNQYGRIKSMLDFVGKQVKESYPSQPIHLIGFEGVPKAGDVLLQVENEDQAKQIVEYRNSIQQAQQSDDLARGNEEKKMRLFEIKTDLQANSNTFKSINHVKAYKKLLIDRENQEKEAISLLEKEQSNQIMELPIIFRADVAGAINAFHEIISKFPTNEIVLRVLKEGVGQITESDIQMAKSANAHIIGMNIKPTEKIAQLAKQNKLQISSFRVIYHLIDHLKKTLAQTLPPIIKENVVGEAECKDIFEIDNKDVSKVAGCSVLQGAMMTSAEFYRVLRFGKPVYDRMTIHSLFHFKDKVKEVKKGSECGIALQGYDEPKKGDRIQAIQTMRIPRTFEDMVELAERKHKH